MTTTRIIVLTAVALCAGSALAQQQQTSLGDVVRQNKPTKHATKVITDEDIPSRPQESEAAQVSAAAAASTETTDATKPVDKDATKETKESKAADKIKEDSAEVAAMKSRVKQLDTDIEGLQRNIEGAKRGLKEIDDPERRQIIENAMKNREYSLRHAQSEREDLTKKLDDASKPKSQ